MGSKFAIGSITPSSTVVSTRAYSEKRASVTKLPVQDALQQSKPTLTLVSWLEAVGIPFEPTGVFDCALRVRRPGGTFVEVALVKDAAHVPPGCGVYALVGELTGLHHQTALKAFWRVTEAAGYGRPVPVDRGSLKEKATNCIATKRNPYSKDFDLQAFRHNEFRQVPDLTPKTYAHYDGVIMTACKFYFRKNKRACLEMGYDLADLKQLALVWTTIYMGKSRVLNPTNTKHDDNEALLYKALRQRFAEFNRMLNNRHKSALPEFESVTIATGIDVVSKPISDSQNEGRSREFTAVAPVAEAEDVQVPVGHNQRARSLAEALLDLPQDILVAFVGRGPSAPVSERERSVVAMASACWRALSSQLTEGEMDELVGHVGVVLAPVERSKKATTWKRIANAIARTLRAQQQQALISLFLQLQPILDPAPVDVIAPATPGRIDIATDSRRASSAKSLLAEALNALPHDKMLEVLAETASSKFASFDAQQEARRQLQLRAGHCIQCTDVFNGIRTKVKKHVRAGHVAG